MGKYDDAMYRYLSDNDRFADLFNAVLFGGRAVVQGELLEDASERCVDVLLDPVLQAENGRQPRYEKSVRDIRKRMRTGERNDLSCFCTNLKLLLEVLQLRQDKDGLIKLWSGESFSHLDLETAETMAVMTDSVDVQAEDCVAKGMLIHKVKNID